MSISPSPDPLAEAQPPPVEAAPARRFPGLGGAILLLALGALLASLAYGLGAKLSGGNEQVALVSMYVLGMGGSTWIALRLRGTRAAELFLPVRRPLALAGSLAVLLVGMWTLLFAALGGLLLLWPMPAEVVERMRQVTGTGVTGFLLGVLVVPVLEEITTQGVILAGFLERYRPWVAIVLGALLFAAGHGIWWKLIPTFAGGLLAGWLFYRTGSLIPSIAVHVAQNGAASQVVALLAGGFGVPAAAFAGPGAPVLPAPLILLGGVLLILGVVLTDRVLPRGPRLTGERRHAMRSSPLAGGCPPP